MFHIFLEKNMYSTVRMFQYIMVRINWFIGFFKSFISLVIFCLVVLPIIENGLLISPTFTVGFISPFNSTNFCFMYFGSLLLDEYTYNYYTFWLNWPFFIIKWLYLSLPIFFWSFFPPMLAFLWLLFAWCILFHPFIFNLFVFESQICVSCRLETVGFLNPVWQSDFWLDCLIHSHLMVLLI